MIKDTFDLTGKTALVVGGRGFLGRRFALALDEFGARVYAADMSEPSPAASKDTSAPGSETSTIRQLDVDVTNEEAVCQMVSAVVSESSQIDILIYAATTKPRDFYRPFTECSLAGWQDVLRVELDGLFLVTREVGRVMEQAKRGSMVLLSSIYGVVGNDQRIYEGSNLAALYANADDGAQRIFSHAVYPAAKGGVIALTRFLAAYWGHLGIRVNCISPGGLAHPGENEDFVARYSARVPLARKAKPDEISGAVVFLASPAADYITGHNLMIDGGWTTW
jgi:NAD(P)-dependent dehydrogenase (short-subunit alcohol dehydrogenase family)